MMCCHGGNPIFFNKKNKDWTSKTSLTPSPYPTTSDNISILSYPPPTHLLPKSGRHISPLIQTYPSKGVQRNMLKAWDFTKNKF